MEKKMNMNKIALIIPFFGRFPDYTRLFLISASYNSKIDFLIFSDCDLENLPSNVRLYKSTFSEIRNMFQQKFDFDICLDQPYKLCDYRPAYGYIFEEYLEGYEFWGHCDLDMVLGDIMGFLSTDVLTENMKIYQHGHLCMYRNLPEVNSFFMKDGGMDYRDVFTTSINKIFDEIPGIQQKFDNHGVKTYKAWDFLDIEPWKYHMQRALLDVPSDVLKNNFDYHDECFFFEDGKVYRAYLKDKSICYQEFNYFHFQKRSYKYVQNVFSRESAFFLTNTGILPKKKGFNVTEEDIRRYNSSSFRKELLYSYKKFKFIWKRRINKYIYHKG